MVQQVCMLDKNSHLIRNSNTISNSTPQQCWNKQLLRTNFSNIVLYPRHKFLKNIWKRSRTWVAWALLHLLHIYICQSLVNPSIQSSINSSRSQYLHRHGLNPVTWTGLDVLQKAARNRRQKQHWTEGKGKAPESI